MMNALLGKIFITGDLTLESGLHIGGGDAFAAIGAVDNTVVRDTTTKQPYIPGSSIKGKMRFLLARARGDETGQTPSIKDERPVTTRLFGSSEPVILSRLQFFDIFMKDETVERLEILTQEAYLAEVKYENTIIRKTAVATPRQMERVPRSSVFAFKLVYNIENIEEAAEDWEAIRQGFKLLEDDYLGGGGSRGSGRISFGNLKAETKCHSAENKSQIEALNLSLD